MSPDKDIQELAELRVGLSRQLRLTDSQIRILALAERLALLAERLAGRIPQFVARPESEWHEDFGSVCWWTFPVKEPAWIGTPLDDSWPGYHTHWTPHPSIPETPHE